MKTDVFFINLREKLTLIKLGDSRSPDVKWKDAKGVVTGATYELEFDGGQIFRFWLGLNKLRMRLQMHIKNTRPAKELFELLSHALNGLGWTLQVGGPAERECHTIHASFALPNFESELAYAYVEETAYLLQIILSVLHAKRVPCELDEMPGAHIELTQ
jgi:hypothetical protein